MYVSRRFKRLWSVQESATRHSSLKLYLIHTGQIRTLVYCPPPLTNGRGSKGLCTLRVAHRARSRLDASNPYTAIQRFSKRNTAATGNTSRDEHTPPQAMMIGEALTSISHQRVNSDSVWSKVCSWSQHKHFRCSIRPPRHSRSRYRQIVRGTVRVYSASIQCRHAGSSHRRCSVACPAILVQCSNKACSSQSLRIDRRIAVSGAHVGSGYGFQMW